MKWLPKSWFNAGSNNAADDDAGASGKIDVHSPSFIAAPLPHYERLRATAPCAALASGGYLLTRADDIQAALTDPALGNAPSRFSALADKHRKTRVCADVAHNIPPFLDKPRHVPIRQAVSAAFRATLKSTDEWLTAIAMAQAASLPAGAAIDVTTGFARPYAMATMARFVGIPHDPAQINKASAAIFRMFAPVRSHAELDETNQELTNVRAFLHQALTAGPDPSGMMAALSASSDLSPVEVCDNIMLILADGIENIEAAIASSFVICAAQDAARQLFLSIPDEQMSAWVAEALRLESPAQIIPRVAVTDHQRHGVEIKAGTPVFLALGSANHDPAFFADPGRFDLTRAEPDKLVFGGGRHSCIGALLAKKMTASALLALRARKVVAIQTEGPVSYADRFGHRWPRNISIRLG